MVVAGSFPKPLPAFYPTQPLGLGFHKGGGGMGWGEGGNTIKFKGWSNGLQKQFKGPVEFF